MRPLAIFGGTFDPVHNAHLRVAWEAAEFLGVAQLVGLDDLVIFLKVLRDFLFHLLAK